MPRPYGEPRRRSLSCSRALSCSAYDARTSQERQAIRQIIDSGQDLAALLDELLASTERDTQPA